MALEQDNTSRDYLYGRLLAIADKIESTALYLSGEKRMTTAERYMQRFADRPATTWLNITKALAPYQQRLNNQRGGLLTVYNRLIDDIHYLFASADFKDDGKLSGEYLLGFHCQRKWLNDHKSVDGQWVLKSQETNTD